MANCVQDPQCPWTLGLSPSVLEVPGWPVLKSSHEGGPEMGGAVIAMETSICIMLHSPQVSLHAVYGT